MLGKKTASKVFSFSLREDNLDIQFPTWWHAVEIIQPLGCGGKKNIDLSDKACKKIRFNTPMKQVKHNI